MMTNPLQQKYQKAKKADTAIMYLTMAASVATVVSFALSRISYGLSAVLVNILDIISCLIMTTIAAISVYCDSIQRKVEDQRRKTNVDDAYLKRYADQQSQGYYTNDSQKIGLGKLSLNHFESCYFTNRIASEMVKQVRMWTLFADLTLVIFTFIKDTELYVCICNLGIIAFVLSDWIRLEVLVSRTSSIMSRYRTHYSTKNNANAISRDSERILLALDYEAAISWSHVLLSERIYDRSNERLSKEWMQIKQDYNLA